MWESIETDMHLVLRVPVVSVGSSHQPFAQKAKSHYEDVIRAITGEEKKYLTQRLHCNSDDVIQQNAFL